MRKENFAILIIIGGIIFLIISFSYLAIYYSTPEAKKKENRVALIETNKGKIKILLYEDKMPITTKNFIELASSGFYNGLKFHRVEEWVIQTGDPKGDGTGGSNKTIPLETHDELKNRRGMVGMARQSDPNSATSQFYILKKDASWLDGQYAVFGEVIEGMDVVDSVVIGDIMVNVSIEKE